MYLVQSGGHSLFWGQIDKNFFGVCFVQQHVSLQAAVSKAQLHPKGCTTQSDKQTILGVLFKPMNGK